MKNILKKLFAIQSELQSVEKSGYNEFNKYKYVKESDVLDVVRPLLLKHSVLLLEDTHEITNIGDMTQLKSKYTWCCVDSGESLSVFRFSQGCDKQDKGVYKAYTGGLKYFLMKSFLISSEDDPENEKDNKSAHTNKEPSDKTTNQYVYTMGIHKGKTFDEVGLAQVKKDLEYWIERLKKEGKQPTGQLKEFMNAANDYNGEDIPF